MKKLLILGIIVIALCAFHLLTIHNSQAVGPGTPNYWCINNNILSPCSSAWSFSGNPANVPANFATNGCFGSGSTTDLGACINLAYSQAVSSTRIVIPPLAPFTSFNTAIVFGTNGVYADLECAPGQTLLYNGTGTAITYDEGTGVPSSSHLPHLGGSNCIFAGATSAATTATTTMIQIGVTNGESQLTLNNFGAINGGTGWHTSTGTYMLTLNSPMARGDVQDWLSDAASASGESLTLNKVNFVDPGNSSSSNCFQLNPTAVASLEVFGGSFDDCQVRIRTGNLNVAFYGVHMEDASPGTYGTYDKIIVDNDTATHFIMYGGTMMEDATSTSAGGPIPEYGKCSAFCEFFGVTAARNTNATTTTKFIVPVAGGGANSNIAYCNVENQNSAFSSLFNAINGATTNNGCLYSTGNNYPTGWDFQAGVNTGYFYAGNNGVGMNFVGNIGGASTAVNWLIGTGTNQASSTLQVRGATTSTIEIGDKGTNAQSKGCLEMGTASGTQQLEYIYVDSNSVLFATSTKPSFCT